jgi:hypothetical protein
MSAEVLLIVIISCAGAATLATTDTPRLATSVLAGPGDGLESSTEKKVRRILIAAFAGTGTCCVEEDDTNNH